MELLSGEEIAAQMEIRQARKEALEAEFKAAQDIANQALVSALTAVVATYPASVSPTLLDVLARLLNQHDAGSHYWKRAELQALYAAALAARAECIRLDAELQALPAQGRRVALI